MEKYRIEILFWAEQDLNEIALYYKNISNELGNKFYSEVRNVIESLKINPFYQTDFNKIRKIPLKKFPYQIYFKINEIQKIVYVEAIISDRQNSEITRVKL